jgi:hypothetical protein
MRLPSRMSAFGGKADMDQKPGNGPAVRRKRISSSGGSGLASMYPAFDWSVSLLAIMGISAGAISLAERPDRAIWVTSVRTRR